MIQAYLLAAGQGLRAGGPKAWQKHEGRTLLERQLDFLLGFFPAERIAVSVQEAWLERCRGINETIVWVPVDPQAKPLGALQELLRCSLPKGWAFLHHVDMPVWERGLFETLSGSISEAKASRTLAVVPVHQGKKGHPVLLSPKAGAQILSLDPAKDRLDFWLRGRNLHIVEVPFPCILQNWNEPTYMQFPK